MGEKLRTSANEGNLPIGSISIVVFQAMEILREFTSFDRKI